MIKTFFSFFTFVSDKHGNKNKTTIVSQPWKIVLETTIKGQSFQVVLDNEAFFSCQTNGFLHRSSFYRKTEKQKPTVNLQIDISLSLAFSLIIKKVTERKKKRERPLLPAATLTVKERASQVALQKISTRKTRNSLSIFSWIL